MITYKNETKQKIRDAYDTLTPAERCIGSFFIENTQSTDFSSKKISTQLYVSEAGLSRFAKKCGFKGYREFIFSYENDLSQEPPEGENLLTEGTSVKTIGQAGMELLDKCCAQFDEARIINAAKMLTACKKAVVVGIGASRLSAMEFEYRFMQLGIDVEAITDPRMMRVRAALASADTLFIGISLSGKTEAVMQTLETAGANGAPTLLITGSTAAAAAPACSEVLTVYCADTPEADLTVSSQYAVLLLTDTLYAFCFAQDVPQRKALCRKVNSALHIK